MVEHKNGDERRINLAVTLTKIEGRLTNIDDHLARLNTFNKACLERDDEREKEFNALKISFSNCQTKHDVADKTKLTISAKTITIISLIASCIIGGSMIYINATKGKAKPAEFKYEVEKLRQELNRIK